VERTRRFIASLSKSGGAAAERRIRLRAALDHYVERLLADQLAQLAEDDPPGRQRAVEGDDLGSERIGRARALEEGFHERDLGRGLEAIDDREDVEQLESSLGRCAYRRAPAHETLRQDARQAFADPRIVVTLAASQCGRSTSA